MIKNINLYLLFIWGLFCVSEVFSQDYLIYEKSIDRCNDKTSFDVESDSTMNFGRNYFYVNTGLIGGNLNYERNIIHYPAAWTNMRVGVGLANDLQGGCAEYIVALVQLFGRRNSHVEFNLGLLYEKNFKKNSNPSADSFRPYYYTGYRFEQPNGHFIFRTGLLYPSVYALSVGVGIKF